MDKYQIRFWKKVKKTNSCWEWQGFKNPKGYGSFWDGEKKQRSHRFSWKISNGEIPVGKIIMHKCDNPPCVRLSHLFIGTPKDNTDDMIRKGRKDWKTPLYYLKLESEKRKQMTHCKRGHEFNKINTRISNGKRNCKKCAKMNGDDVLIYIAPNTSLR